MKIGVESYWADRNTFCVICEIYPSQNEGLCTMEATIGKCDKTQNKWSYYKAYIGENNMCKIKPIVDNVEIMVVDAIARHDYWDEMCGDDFVKFLHEHWEEIIKFGEAVERHFSDGKNGFLLSDIFEKHLIDLISEIHTKFPHKNM